VQVANYNFVTQEQLQKIGEIHEKPSNQHIQQITKLTFNNRWAADGCTVQSYAAM